MTASYTVLGVFIAYLIVLLFLGLLGRRDSQSVVGYYVAGKKLPSWVIAFSSNATGESGWLLLGLTGMGYLVGIHALWVVLGEVLGVTLGWVLVGRPFKAYTDRYDAITVPDFLEARFRDTRHWLRFLSVAIILPMVAVYLAAQVLTRFRYLYPDQLFLILLLFVLGVQKGRRIRLFLVDWLPFIVFVMLYTMMRSFAPRLYSRVHVIEPYQWELTTFGWMANGDIPAFALQEWRATHADETLTIVTDVVLAVAYVVFFITPIVLMGLLWWKLKDRRLFWRFSCTLNLLNFMALATFVLYPAAPPWYYQKFGEMQPAETVFGQAAAGGLLHLDTLFNMGLFATVWESFNPNAFAAVPSLHGAWPVAVAMFTLLAFGRKAWPIVLYPALVAVAGAYFNHHYLIDYVIGWAYLLLAFVVIERVVMPQLDRVMDYTALRTRIAHCPPSKPVP